MNTDRLKSFTGGIKPPNAEDILRSAAIKKVVCYALGPLGTNIEQAATRWLERIGVADKGEIVLGETPEHCLHMAREVKEDGVVAVFWTCAVYVGEAEFFFTNPDTHPFFFQQEMALDEMQLAIKPEKLASFNGLAQVPAGWLVASHPSPAPLVQDFGCEIVLSNSNAAAAKSCALGEVELCITTEKAREIYGLTKVHSFGSPSMIFFGGVTSHGFAQIANAAKQ